MTNKPENPMLVLFLFFAGLIGSAEISGAIFWTYLALHGEHEAQILFRSKPPDIIFLWSVPAGTFIGIIIAVFIFKFWKLKGVSGFIIGAWLLATIIGYPTSLFYTLVIPFGLSNVLSVSIIANILIIATVCVAAFTANGRQ